MFGLNMPVYIPKIVFFVHLTLSVGSNIVEASNITYGSLMFE